MDAEAALLGCRYDVMGARGSGAVRAGGDVSEREALAAPRSEDAEDTGGSGALVGAASEGAAPGRRHAVAVQVTSSGKALEAGQEARRGRRRGRLREHVLQRALGVRLRLAPGTGGQVREDPLTRLMTELSVHQGGETVSQVLLCEVPLRRFRP